MRQQKVFLGEIGNVSVAPPIDTTPLQNVDLDKLSLRELCVLALECNFDVRLLIGINTCNEHYGMVLLADKEMPEGYNLFEHCVYCKKCWTFYRLKRL